MANNLTPYPVMGIGGHSRTHAGSKKGGQAVSLARKALGLLCMAANSILTSLQI